MSKSYGFIEITGVVAAIMHWTSCVKRQTLSWRHGNVSWADDW